MTAGLSPHLGGRALGDLLAEVEHAMRSQMPMTRLMSCSMSSTVKPGVADPADERHQLELLGRVEARGGLVEQQQLRLGRQRPGDLEPALVAVGQVAWRPRSAAARDAHELEQLACARSWPVALLARGAAEAASSAPGTLVRWWASAPTMTFSSAVISGNSRMFWNVRAMPTRVISVRLAAADRLLAREADVALGRLVDAGDAR